MMVADITSLAIAEQKEDLVSEGLCPLSQIPSILEGLAESPQSIRRGCEHSHPRRSLNMIQFYRCSNHTWGKCSQPVGPVLRPQCRANTYIHERLDHDCQTSSLVSFSIRHVFGSSSWPVQVAKPNMTSYHGCRSRCAPLHWAIGRHSKTQSLLQQQA